MTISIGRHGTLHVGMDNFTLMRTEDHSRMRDLAHFALLVPWRRMNHRFRPHDLASLNDLSRPLHDHLASRLDHYFTLFLHDDSWRLLNDNFPPWFHHNL